MAHRVNVIFDDAVWQQLEEVPKGERSKLINQAVSESLVKYRRLRAIAALDELRKSMPKLPGTTEQWIREDRDSHE
jgi:hypothetical protein